MLHLYEPYCKPHGSKVMTLQGSLSPEDLLFPQFPAFKLELFKIRCKLLVLSQGQLLLRFAQLLILEWVFHLVQILFLLLNNPHKIYINPISRRGGGVKRPP